MRYNRLDGFTHVCFDKEYSGLAYDLWFDSLGSRRNKKSRPIVVYARVKKMLIPVFLQNGVAYIKQKRYRRIPGMIEVMDYISSNYTVIEDHWNGKLSDLGLLNNLDNSRNGGFDEHKDAGFCKLN